MNHYYAPIMDKFFKIPRLFVEEDLLEGKVLTLSKPQSHYVRNVLRMTLESPLRLFDGKNGEFLAHITSLGKMVEVKIEKRIRSQKATQGPWLFFTPLKKNRLDFLIEKAVELGVEKLCPLLTERTVVRSINLEKMHQHVIEAAEQCERLTFPEIAPLTPLKKALEKLEKERPLYFCQERGEGIPTLSSLNPAPKSALLVGPEGGFTHEETLFLLNTSHIHPISLGENILRAETASLCGLSILGYS